MTTRPPGDLHDPRFDDAWRRASRETPPAALDDAIRAAARREVGARPQDVSSVREATRPERWWFPLAAAATIGAIAIGLLQISTSDRIAPADERRVVSDVPEGAKPLTPASEPTHAPAATMPLAKEHAEASAPVDTLKPEREGKPAAAAPTPPPPVAAAPARAPSTGITSAAPPPPASPSAEKAQRQEPQPFPDTQKRDQAPSPNLPQQAEAVPRKAEAAAQAPGVAQSPASSGRTNLPQETESDLRSASKSRVGAAPMARSADASNGAAAGTIAAAPSDGAAAVTPPVAAPPMAAPQRAAATLSAARSDSVDARAKERAAMPVAEWIALMRRLRDEQRFDELAKELAAFRSLHADANALLPPELRDVALPAPGTR